MVLQWCPRVDDVGDVIVLETHESHVERRRRAYRGSWLVHRLLFMCGCRVYPDVGCGSTSWEVVFHHLGQLDAGDTALQRALQAVYPGGPGQLALHHSWFRTTALMLVSVEACMSGAR